MSTTTICVYCQHEPPKHFKECPLYIPEGNIYRDYDSQPEVDKLIDSIRGRKFVFLLRSPAGTIGVYNHPDGYLIRSQCYGRTVIEITNDPKLFNIIVSRETGDARGLSEEEIQKVLNMLEEIRLEVFLESKPRPVMCQGICTSQFDDYCGMHMSNESCIACDAIWKQAHEENKQYNL